MPYLKCVDKNEAKYILEEVHEGICGNHAGPRSLVSKIIKTGYFWPTMQKDAREFAERYDKCQRFGNVQRIPAERLTPITSPWPFAQWGIDIVGLLLRGHPQANGQMEVTNRTLLKIIKARLEESKGIWLEELPNVLLTYGTETIIPVRVGITSMRREVFSEGSNDDQLRVNLDCLDEVRDGSSQKMTKYQQKMAKYYNKRVKLKRLNIGDFVLRKVTFATKDPT
ncbi:uncharacterized protein LOC142620211 [Castanea sativa]|uniref:uncharacterized protein LOC142620211 n=1 Tax=Castanea sativa TaxID=21020 RepID=UPI003F64E45B